MAKKRKARRTGKTAKAKRARKTTRARRAAPRLAISAMTSAQRTALFRVVEAALARHRVKPKLVALHFTPEDAQLLLCQAPKVRRMVCRKINGVVKCLPMCVDP